MSCQFPIEKPSANSVANEKKKTISDKEGTKIPSAVSHGTDDYGPNLGCCRHYLRIKPSAVDIDSQEGCCTGAF